MKLKDLKIIVTGGAQGMGAHFATRLAEAGAQVAAGDVNEEGLADARRARHRTARRLDVVQRGRRASRSSSWAHGAMGGLNGLINNAGILRDGLLVKKDRTTGADQEAHQGAVGRGHRRQPHRRDASWCARSSPRWSRPSSAPASSSTCRRIARHGNRGQSNYVAAKAALAANTVTWAREFAPFGIRVGAVAPGMIETPMTQGMNQKARDALVADDPGRPHRPARGHLARGEVRPRVRLLQRPHHRRRRRPHHVVQATGALSGPARHSTGRRGGVRPIRPARAFQGAWRRSEQRWGRRPAGRRATALPCPLPSGERPCTRGPRKREQGGTSSRGSKRNRRSGGCRLEVK